MTKLINNRLESLKDTHSQIMEALQRVEAEGQRLANRRDQLIANRLKVEGALEALADLSNAMNATAGEQPVEVVVESEVEN